MMSSDTLDLLASHILSLLVLMIRAAEATKGKRRLQITSPVTYDMHTRLATHILLQ